MTLTIDRRNIDNARRNLCALAGRHVTVTDRRNGAQWRAWLLGVTPDGIAVTTEQNIPVRYIENLTVR